MGARCLLLRSRIQNDPGPVPDAAEPLPRARGSDSRIEVNQAGAEKDPSHTSLFQGSSTKRVESIGGFLVQTFDWRWIFLVNLPICAVGIVLTLLFVPETRDPAVSRHIDVPGLLTLSMAIICIVLALIEENEWGWSSVCILSLCVVA